jgi:hypothetical protein|tara:strand:+ start:1361 stop:1567 length:207 start_codon:yes stop_codon:yes gene_type:complete
VRQLIEITGMAGLLFALPICYYYGRPYVLKYQDKAYDVLFKIDEDQYRRMKEIQRHAREQEMEVIKKN